MFDSAVQFIVVFRVTVELAFPGFIFHFHKFEGVNSSIWCSVALLIKAHPWILG